MPKISRLKAGLIHFSISLSLFTLVFFILFTLWYPEPFFTAGGGWQGLKIIASIDIVLGPLLTLVVFNPSKSLRELKLDLSVIGIMQLCAFCWGIFTVYQQRPVAAVFYDECFYTVSANELSSQNYALSELKRYSDLSPPLIFVERPTDTEGLKKFLARMRDDGIGPHLQTDNYQALTKHFNELSNARLNIEKLRSKSVDLNKQIEKFLQNSGLAPSDIQFYLLKAKYQDMVLIFKTNGELVGHLMLPTKTAEDI